MIYHALNGMRGKNRARRALPLRCPATFATPLIHERLPRLGELFYNAALLFWPTADKKEAPHVTTVKHGGTLEPRAAVDYAPLAKDCAGLFGAVYRASVCRAGLDGRWF